MKGLGVYRDAAAGGLAILSGVLLALALPPRETGWIGWIAFLPLLVASRLARRSLIAAFYGLVAAAVSGVAVAGGQVTDVQLGNQIAAFGGLGLVLAFIAGWSSFGSRRLRPGLWAVFVPCAAITGEYLSQIVFPISAAISQQSNHAALWAVSYTGIWGVSFALWFLPASTIALFTRPRSAWPAVGCVVLLAVALAGSRFAPAPHGPAIRLAAVQAETPEAAAAFTRKIMPAPDAAVWPELLAESDRDSRSAAVCSGACIVSSHIEHPRSARPHNIARVIAPNGRSVGVFRKKHLFGKEKFIYARGGVRAPVRCGRFRAGCAICFDTEFTDVTRRLARSGAQAILVPNGDPVAPNHLFSHLHSAVIPFRAAETGVPVAFADHDHGSMVVDGGGRIVARVAESGRPAVGVVHLPTGRTFFALAGDWLAYACIACALGLAVLSKISSRK